MNSHRSSRDLMQGAEFVDFQAYAHLPYYTEQYFSKDRWALTGEAGAFVDPFYSPGSDFIATANEFIVSIVDRVGARRRHGSLREEEDPDLQRLLQVQVRADAQPLREALPDLRLLRGLPAQVPARLQQLLQRHGLAVPERQAPRRRLGGR